MRRTWADGTWADRMRAVGSGRGRLLSLVVSLALPVASAAQEPPDTIPGASDPAPRVFLVTAGPGGVVWERFGHNGLWIHRPDGPDRMYHWGVFSFQAEDFWPRLLTGHMRYAMVGIDPDRWVRAMVATDRTVRSQEIALEPDEVRELVQILRSTDTDEARWYEYDYYLDNCSTRARDHLDRVLGGVIQDALLVEAEASEPTFRWHTRRLLGKVPAAYLGIQLALGPRADQPLTPWAETFTPPVLAEELTRVRRADGSPLVISDRLLHETTRFPEPDAPPSFLWIYLLLGTAGAAGFALLAVPAARGHFWAARPLGVAGAMWGLGAGLLGALLAGAWLFTDHIFWYQNQNLLQANPLALALVPAFALTVATGRLPAWAVRLAVVLALLSVTGLVMKALPGLEQANGEVIALFLPLHLGVAWGAWRIAEREAPAGGPP